MYRESEVALVVDVGSSTFKFGFAGENIPRIYFPAVVSKHKEKPKILIGTDALYKREEYETIFPVQRGLIEHWKEFEEIFSHTFYSTLKLEKTRIPVLLTEPCMNPKAKRERLCQLLFENFEEVCVYYVASVSVLSLYASGKTTGLVITSGHGHGEIAPIYEGYALPHAFSRFDKNGEEITRLLRIALEKKGYIFKTQIEKDIVRDIKEKFCFLSLEPQKEELKKFEYILPNKKVIKFDREAFMIPEIIFKSNVEDKRTNSLTDLAFEVVLKCAFDIRGELLQNLVLAGGNTLLKNFDKKLQYEMSKHKTLGHLVTVYGQRDRSISAWIGGSILGSLTTQSMWIHRNEYEESGPKVVHRKCF